MFGPIMESVHQQAMVNIATILVIDGASFLTLLYSNIDITVHDRQCYVMSYASDELHHHNGNIVFYVEALFNLANMVACSGPLQPCLVFILSEL